MCAARFTICAVLVILFTLTAACHAGYSGGSGTEAEPFRISTVSDWQELMTTPADWASHFVLTADIDLNGVPITPVGNDANNFTGIFDGNDHIIRNADVNMPDSDYVALFGYLGTGGQIKNLGVEDISIFARSYVGGLVGYDYYGDIINSYSSGSVSGEDFVGGLVGYTEGGFITNSYSTGSVSGSGSVGGLVGYDYYGDIINSYSTGVVTGTADSVGGLAGLDYGATISNCYSTGSVSGDYFVGGLVGENPDGTVSNCYSTGAVNGDKYVGGLVGYTEGELITNSYSSGSVSGSGSVGGLVGDNDGTVSNSFWDVNTSGWPTSDGGTGKTTSQMQDISTFLEAGWDFVAEPANGTCSFWEMPEAGGYPVLSTLHGYIPPEPPGSGSETDPYIITDANGLGTIWYRPVACYVMANDIDLAGISWSAPVVPLFGGVFDGNDHTLRNVDVNMPGGDGVGLFGYLGIGSQIKNLGAEDASILGKYYVGGLVGSNGGNITNCYSSGSVGGRGYVGGLVGLNYGAISNCYSTGSVTGGYSVGGLTGYNDWYGTIINSYSTGVVTGTTDYVGGLAGYSDWYGTIINCYSTGMVTGMDDYVGGLVGYNEYGTVSNCHSTGAVNGDKYVGGLVGHNSKLGAISTCYSTGAVNGTDDYVGGLVGDNEWYDNISRSFWDVNTSGWATSAGGTGRTTSQMQDMNRFLEAGWDFLGETANGTCNFWQMPHTGGYPVLSIVEGYTPAEPAGSGTAEDPYIITDANELGTVWYRPVGCYVMANDIDLAGISWSGAVVPFFSGVFDGNDHTLRNVDVNMPGGDGVGLFGHLATGGQIKNLGVEDISIFGYNDVGGLVGENHGTVRNCYSTGAVNGSYTVGGLVGRNLYEGSISNSYSTGAVSGSYSVGGLVGWNFYEGTISNSCSTGSVSGEYCLGGLVGWNSWDGTIRNCYSTGSVVGISLVGGLVGRNGRYELYCEEGGCWEEYIPGWIYKCYSTGKVSGGSGVGGFVGAYDYGEVGDSFWDVNTSGWTTSAGGTPKTTVEMMTQSTFSLAGWDFVGETGNGTEDIWAICEGTNYPRLVWQIPAADWICPDGVGLEDFNYFGGVWGSAGPDPANLDGEDGIGFGDLMIFCEEWLSGR